MENNPSRVNVYTKQNCVQCDATTRYMNGHGIPSNEIPLEENPEKVQEFVDRGIMQAPIVEHGDALFAGFRPDKLAELAIRIAEIT